MIKAVIFDFDGVIADSKKTIFKIYREVCRELGIKFYSSISDFSKNIDGNYKHFYIKLGIKRAEFAKTTEAYRKHYLRFEREFRAFPEVRGVLSQLKRRGIKIGISSNTHAFILRRLLRKFGLISYIDAIAGGKDIDKLKPDPQQILIAMKRLGVEPKETVFIGDMEADMIAGRRAKVAKLVAVTYGYHPRKYLKKYRPDAFASNPQQIIESL